MLTRLTLDHVGPTSHLEIEFSSRLNLLTGDNGLGKSFLIDVAWWALTRTWARELVVPHLPPSEPKIDYAYDARSKEQSFISNFDRVRETWQVPRGRPPIPGLVLYAQVDGGFSVWDPARNYWRGETPDRPQAFSFLPNEVWQGAPHCEGLLRDWASWQREQSTAFQQLTAVLRTLSPSPDELLKPGELRKVYLEDPKKHPTLQMPYGQEVPLIHASAGMRRILALAYLLVWTWQEHLAACELTGTQQASEIIFLVDEIEAHLHPQWQRRVIPALLEVMDVLTGSNNAGVQVIAATHSPLVLASTEPIFEPSRDTVWELKLREGDVVLERFPWSRQGDASAWLTSSIFELEEAGSVPAEQAMGQALELLRENTQMSVSPERIHRVDAELRKSLGDTDSFWVRWSAFKEKALGEI